MITCMSLLIRRSQLSGVLVPVRFKGHAKWQNIKGTKEANEAKRHKLAIIHRNNIVRCIKEHGNEANPQKNTQLRKAIDAALADNMNRGLVDRALKSAQDKSVQIENEVLFELMGPKRSMIIVECLARDRKYATGFVAAIYKKHVFVPEPGILSHFEKRGVIVLEGPESVEKAEEIAIECDCEEVESTDDPNTFIIFCDPRLVPTRRDALANFGSVLSAEVSFIPLSPIEGSEKLKERIQTLRDKLMEVPCVVNVHDNLES